MKNSAIKVVLDTNIFIDALFRDIPSAIEILELIDSDNVAPCFSQETIGELMYVLKKQLINSNSDSDVRSGLMLAISEMFLNSKSCNTKLSRSPRLKDRDDEMFVKCAIRGKVKYLISNDKKSGMHSLHSMKFDVVTSKEFIDEYNQIIANSVINE